jgi:hypothetical protein
LPVPTIIVITICSPKIITQSPVTIASAVRNPRAAPVGLPLDFRADLSLGIDYCRGDFSPAHIHTDGVSQSDILAP